MPQARFAGRFEQAEGGTLFLDEIGDMPMEAQTRLLRVLQEGEYTTVGGRTPIKTNVRIVAATHRELKSQIQQGLFREDLFYRLNVVPLRLPPLRERVDDIGDLVRHFLKVWRVKASANGRSTPGRLSGLKLHHWPGNVRELENLVRRVAAIYGEEHITRDIVETVLSETDVQPSPIVQNEEALGLGEMVENYMARYFSEFGDELPPPGLYDRVVRRLKCR